MANALTILHDDRMRLHSAGPSHPERPERLESIERALRPFADHRVTWRAPAPADHQHLARVHDLEYLAFLESLRGRHARLDADTVVNEHSIAAAMLAAGAATESVNEVLSTSRRTAFALVRPPGHHAERDRAMGFCLVNNIAVAAAHAIAEFGLERIMIVDWDVHHGNGTQHIFESRRDVLCVSTHQWPLWPGTGSQHEHGRDDGEGFTINCPLPAGFDDAGYVTLFKRLIDPVADQYRPQLVLISAGFDAHHDDPLAAMRVTSTGFAQLCAIVQDIADRHADGRLILILEGGYNLAALAQSAAACVGMLVEGSAGVPEYSVPEETSGVIDRLCSSQRPFWRV